MSPALLTKKIIVEIIRQAGHLTGTTKLHAVFYLAHLFYARESPGFLTYWPIVRTPSGPGIDEGDELLDELVKTGVLGLDSEMVGPHEATRYQLAGKELPGGQLASEALSAITKAVDFVKAWTTSQLSDLTHDYSRSWKETPDGRELNIYIDVIPDQEFYKRQKQLGVLRSRISQASRAIESENLNEAV